MKKIRMNSSVRMFTVVVLAVALIIFGVSSAFGVRWDKTIWNLLVQGNLYVKGYLQIDGYPLSKALTFYVADTGATDINPAAKFVCANDITILRMDYFSQTEIGGNAVTATLQSGASTGTCTIDSGAVFGSQTTTFSFTAADICSLALSDGAAGIGGIGYLTIQYSERDD